MTYKCIALCLIIEASIICGDAKSPDSKRNSQELSQSQKEELGFFNTVYYAPAAVIRHLSSYYCSDDIDALPRQMFGFDKHKDCDEHQKTLVCHSYFLDLDAKIPLTEPIDADMCKKRGKRIKIWGALALRVLQETSPNQIGDSTSTLVLERIARLLECVKTFGSESMERALRKQDDHIRIKMSEVTQKKNSSASTPHTQTPSTQTSQEQTIQAPAPSQAQTSSAKLPQKDHPLLVQLNNKNLKPT